MEELDGVRPTGGAPVGRAGAKAVAKVVKREVPAPKAPAKAASGSGRPREYEHGTLASYTHGACRCEVCRQANTVYHRELRQRLRARIGTDWARVPHGTAGGYANHGRRCRACSRAHPEVMSLAYARRKAARGGKVA